MTTPIPTQWRIPPSSIKEWVGPLTASAFGQPVSTFQVAFLPYGQDPTDTDWEPPVPHPDQATTGLGVLVAEQTAHPLEPGSMYAISIQIDLGQSEPVVENVGIVIAA